MKQAALRHETFFEKKYIFLKKVYNYFKKCDIIKEKHTERCIIMKDFIYDIGTKIYFGKGAVNNLGAVLKEHSSKVLLCYGGGSIKKIGLYDAVLAEIEKAGLELFELSGIEPNPRIESVRTGAEMCKEHKIDVVLAVGGGSTIDAAKFIAAGAGFWEHIPLPYRWVVASSMTLSRLGSSLGMP